jgi:hypothetical protein
MCIYFTLGILTSDQNTKEVINIHIIVVAPCKLLTAGIQLTAGVAKEVGTARPFGSTVRHQLQNYPQCSHGKS